MTKLQDIVFETDRHWVKRVPKGFEVYKTGLTHSTRVAVIGYPGDKGLQRAKDEIARREAGGPSVRGHATKKPRSQLDRKRVETPVPHEGMRVVITSSGSRKHGLREGAHGLIARVSSPDVRKDSPSSMARVLVAVQGTEFSTDWPTASLRVASKGEVDPHAMPATDSSYIGGLRYKAGLKRSHATKKSPAQLDREIAEALGAKPINRRKTVRHFSESKDKLGRTRFAVTYEDLSSHAITPEELQSYRDREARGGVPRDRRYR